MGKKVVRLKRHYHYDTDNISFIKMHKTLKDLGIKNNKFFLLIYDESIKGLDPFDEDNLTIEEKIKIKREISRNPWYYLREIVRIPVPGGSTRYEIHRGNLALTFCLLKNINTLIELPRQNFKTQSFLCLMSWIYECSTTNSDISFLHHKYSESKKNLERLKKIIELLPSYILPPKGKNDVDNLTSIINSRGNNIVAKNSAISEEQADLLGRGNTTPIIFYDEVAFIKYLDTIYTAAAPAQSQASIEAKKRGKPYFKAFLTTPGDVLTPHGKYCKEQMIEPAAPFTEKMYDWTDEEIAEYIDSNSTNNIVYIKFTYQQIGRDEEWFRQQCRELLNDKSRINREILLQWNKSTDLSPFLPEEIDRLHQHAKQAINQIVIYGSYILNIYEEFNFNDRMLIGADFGGESSKDATCLTVVDPITLHAVADFRNNKADAVEMADIILELMTRYLPNSVFVPELNGYSKGCLAILLRTNINTRIYFEYKNKINEVRMDDGTIKKEKIKTKVYGVETTAASRPLMMEIVFYMVHDDYMNIISPLVIEDIAGLERKRKTGKIEHGDTTHDDNLFSYLMARYVVCYGNNLPRFKIYKKITHQAEDMANTGIRSDEEFVGNINMVLSSNFRNQRMEGQSVLQQDIIEEFYQRKQYEREQRELDRIADGIGEVNNTFKKIFSYNNG